MRRNQREQGALRKLLVYIRGGDMNLRSIHRYGKGEIDTKDFGQR